VLLLQALVLTPVILATAIGGSQLLNIVQQSQLDPSMVKIAVFIGLPIGMLLGIVNSTLIAQQRIRVYSTLQVLTAVIQVGLLVFLTTIEKLTALSAVAVYAFAPLPAVLLAAAKLKASSVLIFHLPTFRLIRQLLSYGGRALIGDVLQYFNYRVDVFVVLYLLGSSAVGIYAVSVSIAELIWYVPGAIATVLFPRTALDWEQATQFTPRVSRNVLFVTAIISIFVATMSPLLLITVYGEQYISSLMPLWLLLPGVVILGIAKILASDLAGRGRPEFGTFASGVSLIATIVLDFTLIPIMGVSGAALASTVSYTLTSLLILIAYMRISGNNAFSVLFIKRSDFEMYYELIRKSRGILSIRTQN
jgi:O-antigen/teichoic acid export membrane protein